MNSKTQKYLAINLFTPALQRPDGKNDMPKTSRAVSDELYQIVDEAIALYRADNKPLPPGH